MRVISGIYKGRNLKGFMIEGTRPTMSRVKESVFAMLQNDLQNKKVLDLFAGSGALGIEALSGGASSCVFVDKNQIACDTIKENTKGMQQVSIIKKDSLSYLKNTRETFDLIFLDPPYQENLLAQAIEIIESRNLLMKEGILVCEYEKEAFISTFSLWKDKKYGSTMIRIYKNN